MRTIKLETESYLFTNSNGEFRAIPFYELEYNEWVIYEDGVPKYYFEIYEESTDKLIQSIVKDIKEGKTLDSIVQNLGSRINKNWTIHHNIQGEEDENSYQPEIVELIFLDNHTLNIN